MREPRPLETPPLETERLLLRRFTIADAADVFRHARDPEVARLTSWEAHQSLDDTRRFLDWALARYDEAVGGPWAMVRRDTREVVGAIGLSVVWPHLRGEIGYWVGRAWWRHGLATEAGRAVLRYAFDDLEMNRVEARCETDNIASERVMQKLGMTFEGILRQHVLAKGRFRDMRLYSLLGDEWRDGDAR